MNHPRDAGRPLVEGTASRTELLVLHVAALVLAVLAAVPLGWRAVALIGGALVISQVYSAWPVRLSYRVAGAPVALGLAYVVIPYSVGIVAARGSLRHAQSALIVALVLLFTARIALKDFRDREGDARYGKPTLLLRFGKGVTCGTSLAALVAADVVLALALDVRLVLLVQPFVAAIAWMLRRLWVAGEGRSEQVAIGLGARLGNGLLLCVLAWSILAGSGASPGEALALGSALAAAFLVSVAALAAEPQQVIIGYKG